jgi:hypothetical protein
MKILENYTAYSTERSCDVEQKLSGGVLHSLGSSAMRSLFAAATVIVAFAPCVCADEAVKFQCGIPGPVQAWVIGSNADTVDIVFNGVRIFRDEIRDGNDLNCGSDVMVGGRVVVVRYGRERDLLRFYRIILTGDTAKVAHAKLEWREGPIKLASDLDAHNMVFYAGHEQDLYTRTCWKDKTWMYTPGRWSASSIPQTCTARLETKVAG